MDTAHMNRIREAGPNLLRLLRDITAGMDRCMPLMDADLAALRLNAARVIERLTPPPLLPTAPVRAPWNDFEGRAIHHGDRLKNPDGQEFTVVYVGPGVDDWLSVSARGSGSMCSIGVQRCTVISTTVAA